MSIHELTFNAGTNARNHVVRCTCGWAYSNTYLAVRERGGMHRVLFADEDRRWNDPKRYAEMAWSSQR